MACECDKYVNPASASTDRCIKDLWMFERYGVEQLQALKTIGERRFFSPGQAVFTQGAPADELFLIRSGRIKLNKVQEDGTEVTLDFRKAGDAIGENAFAGDMTYPLSAWALEDTVTCGFSIPNFNELVMRYPDIGLGLIRTMSSKMAAMTDRLESMSENSLENRLYSVLSQVAREHGEQAEGGLALAISLTHEELGFLVGAHRVSVTRALKSLADHGRVVRAGEGGRLLVRV